MDLPGVRWGAGGEEKSAADCTARQSARTREGRSARSGWRRPNMTSGLGLDCVAPLLLQRMPLLVLGVRKLVACTTRATNAIHMILKIHTFQRWLRETARLTSQRTPHADLVVYHVDFHGATSHMGIHVIKVDKLNHDKNHVVIHVVLQRK